MAENDIKVTDQELSQLEKIKVAISKLENKESKFLFAVANSPQPSASVYEIYFHANVAKSMGFDVTMLTDVNDYVVPEYIEKSLTEIEHVSMEKINLKVGPQDVLVIPEIFSNVMEQTKNLGCIRIGLLQSIDYMLNALVLGVDWSEFGIDNILTTSESMRDALGLFYGPNKFRIGVYNVGIPSYFHNNSDDPKRPVISVIGRNPNDVAKVIKLFYAKYPQFKWITFDPMMTESKPPKPLRRVDFADRLRNNFASLWIDRISSFGTFPLEAMKSGSIPVGLVPDFAPEYLITKEGKIAENTGFWTNNIYELPLLLGEVLTKFLDDTIDEKIYDTMEKTASVYTQEKSKEQLEKYYTAILSERKEFLTKAVENYENAVKEQESKNNIEENKEEEKNG
jgi:predicted peroxiredoxin